MRRIRTKTILTVLSVVSVYLSGCGNKFFDPGQVGRFRPVPAVNVILDSLGVAEEMPSPFESAEDPQPADAMVLETDYTFNSGDIVRISIFELFEERLYFQNDYVVTETGKISMPDVGMVEAMGLTESQLEEEIRQILSPSLLREPAVTVTLLTSQKRSFSISGDGVPRPGRYPIPRYDFRLLDALAGAGGISAFNISYVYVARAVTGRETMIQPLAPEAAELFVPEAPQPFMPEAPEPEEPEQLEQPEEPEELEQPEEPVSPEEEMLEILAPRAQRQWPSGLSGPLITSAELVTNKELLELSSPDSFGASTGDEPGGVAAEGVEEPTADEPVGRQTPDQPTEQEGQGRIEWIFQDGKWVPVQIGPPKPPAEPKIKTGPAEERIPVVAAEWEQIGTAGVQTRVIKIPADKLSGGDPRYNIVIKPGDAIQVPVDIIGEFCIMGNVNYQGYINITGRPMTLKMAIAAAGGLGPLAWPKRCEVVRRIGKEKEEIVMVDLDKIASGEQPDFFIKPNDLINVGTHPTSRWRAVLRNAFRATYGFGFVYDRNFADRDFRTRRPIPSWF